MSGGMHYTQIMSDCIDLAIYSDGRISYENAINMSIDETPYLIHIFKRHYTAKEKNKEDLIKSTFEFASKAVEQIIKACQNRRT